MGRTSLNRPVVGVAAAPSSVSYWLVASDSGIFSFGDANFGGSGGGVALDRPLIGTASAA